MSKTTQDRETADAVEACVALLRDDPPRLKRLLREAGALADDVAEVLSDARRSGESKRLHRVANLLRGAALLPAALAAAALRKALEAILVKGR